MHHCRESFKIFSDEKYNILNNLTKEENQEFRKIFIELILSTDMSQHFTFLSKFKSFSRNKTINEFNDLERIELMKLILKSSDVGNVTRPFNIAKKWAKLCIREFISQGDLEKKFNLPLGVLNDGDNLNFPKSQLGFVEYIAGSLFIELVQLFPSLKNIAKEIENNKKIWIKLLKLNKIEIDSEYEIDLILKEIQIDDQKEEEEEEKQQNDQQEGEEKNKVENDEIIKEEVLKREEEGTDVISNGNEMKNKESSSLSLNSNIDNQMYKKQESNSKQILLIFSIFILFISIFYLK